MPFVFANEVVQNNTKIGDEAKPLNWFQQGTLDLLQTFFSNSPTGSLSRMAFATSSGVFAPFLYNTMEQYGQPIENGIVAINRQNAEDSQPQRDNAELQYEFDMAITSEIANESWSLILGLLLLLKDALIFLLLLFEMRIVIWVLITAIPNLFLGLRDGISTAMAQR